MIIIIKFQIIENELQRNIKQICMKYRCKLPAHVSSKIFKNPSSNNFALLINFLVRIYADKVTHAFNILKQYIVELLNENN